MGKTTTAKAPARTGAGADLAIHGSAGTRAIESLAMRGDLSGLGPKDRARYYVQVCESLGLNPHAQPFSFLRLNGKEVLYATRGATDQLAAIHKLNREIIDGPKVIDLAGTKLVFAMCRATLPDGRTETAVATAALVDPVNALMKVESKAKRRVTLSILGLAVLDEQDDAGGVKGEGVDLSLAAGASAQDDAEPAPPRGEVPVDAPAPEEPSGPLAPYYSRIPDLEQAADAVALWMKHRPALAEAGKDEREKAFGALSQRVGQMGVERPGPWLKAEFKAHDERVAKQAAATQGAAS